MQSTSCEMTGWMKHKLESRLLGEILTMSDMQILPAESKEELKNLLMKVEKESKETGIKLNIQKTKIMASGPITLWQIDREKIETVADFIFLGSKTLWMVTESMPWNTLFRKPKDEPQTGRNYFQNTYQRKDLYSYYTKQLLKIW